MQLQYLGTAAAEAFPGIFCHCDICRNARKLGGKNIRGRAGAVLNDKLLIDFSPDAYSQSLKNGIDLGGMNNLVVTHNHLDHFAVQELMMRDTAYFAHLPEGETPLQIYGNDAVVAALHASLKKEFGASERPSFASHEVEPFQPFTIDDIQITPLLALHNRREKCLIYIFEHEGKRLLYGNDTGIFPEEDWQYIAGMHFDLVSLDCTFGPLKDGGNHMGIPDNIEVKQRLASLNCISPDTKFVITHFSHNCGALHEELEKAAQPYGFIVAYDGLAITV